VMRSEFEKLFKSQRSYRSSDKEAFIRGCEAAFKHQQSKVDELQKGNDALVHVIKSRDIQLENEKHEYDELMNKLVDSRMKNAELQKQNAWLSGVAERENKRANKLQEEEVSTTSLLGKTIQEKNELQKRVDAVKQLIEEYRDPPTEDKTFCHALSIVAYELEQALKGGCDEAK